jgi:putative zinc finger/helix-turn-helix YgiT family protein
MSKIHICPFCEEGRTDEVVYSQVFRLGRKAITVEGLRKRVCTQCHSESVPGYLHDHNLDLVQQAEERLPGFAPLSALRSLRERWELSQKAASIIFGAGSSSFGKWESGQSSMSTPSALLVKVALRFPQVVPYLAKLAGVSLGDVATAPESRSSFGAYETVHVTSPAVNGNVFLLTQGRSRGHAHGQVSAALLAQDWHDVASSEDGAIMKPGREESAFLEAA